MKKTFILLFGIILCSTLFSSCRKYCTCVGYIAGKEGEPYRIELNKEEAATCEEKSNLDVVDGVKLGVECK